MININEETQKQLIEEHDIAVFALGSFETCIKTKLLSN